MAIGLNLGPMVNPAIGVGVMSLVNNYLDLKVQNRFIPELENSQVASLVVLGADAFGLLPDGGRAGDMLDGARDGAIYSLVQSAVVPRLLGSALAPAPAPAPATPVAAAQAAGVAQGLTSTPPALNGSLAMDTASAGY